ncbi:MAG TPA: oxidoreductase [Acidimicrobiaceae bacterium]|nr:oxidoreductase [Acidimicrobiaceae bacterium]HCB36895.1 oxidoreductase [Acidimicrobiaceae bacterium]
MADGIYEMMSTQRAVRRLRPDPIPDDVLGRVLQAACWAPTGGNVQPWRMVVVTSAARKAALAAVYRPQWQRYSERMRGDDLPPRYDVGPDEAARARLKRMVAAGDHLADHMAEAPVILMFVGNPAGMAITDSKLDRVSMIGGASVYPAVQNAMLAARVEGLGCVLTTLHCFEEADVQEALDIPPEWATLALVPLGYPVGGGYGPVSRRGVDKMAFDDAFGVPWEGAPGAAAGTDAAAPGAT